MFTLRHRGRRGLLRALSLAVCLGLGMLLALANPAPANEVTAARDAMIEAMLRMMRLMGFDDRASAPAPEWSAQLGLVPELAPFVDPLRAFSLPRTGAPRVSDLPPGIDWRPTTLEGIWEDREGGLLIVIGPRFRIYKLHIGYVDGLIQQRGSRIVLYNPQNGQARPYEYAEFQGRLVLRDPEGNLFLYRRLWLDRDMGPSAAQPAPPQ